IAVPSELTAELIEAIDEFATVDTLVLTPPAPPPPPSITVADEFVDVLEVGNHIVHSNEWGKGALTRGTFTGMGGTTYEQKIGVQYPPAGSQDPIGLRIDWAWPTGPNEVKSYPSIITGNFPGWLQTGTPNIAGTW